MPNRTSGLFLERVGQLFAVDGYYGVPHSTKNPYYRCLDLTRFRGQAAAFR